MINIKEINKVVLPQSYINERLKFFKTCKRTPSFEFLYTTNLLRGIEMCSSGLNDINGIFDNTLEMLECLNINFNYEDILNDMYEINETQIHSLPKIHLIDNSVQGILVNCK